MKTRLSILCIAALGSLGFWTTQAQAESVTEFMARDLPDCDVFFETVNEAEIADEPDYFFCNDFIYKPLYLYGYVRDTGQGTFTMTLLKGRKIACAGDGELVWDGSGNSRTGSASGRFRCDDGAEGGLAFSLEVIRDFGTSFEAGTVYGGVDSNGSGGADEVISADFYMLSGKAIRTFMANR